MHIPVLLNEVLENLNIKEDAIYVDCTLGLGGHSKEILKRLSKKGILIGLEQDENALKIAKDNLSEYSNCYLFNTNFVNLPDVLKELKIEKITGGVLIDLGVSSLQFDTAERGFSFQNDGPLDMRMDKNSEVDAYYVVNKYRENELADVIFNYGEERLARKIARFIVENRLKKPINTTLELANIILRCYPKGKWFKTHPATKTFQALRIEVNKELEVLDKFLCFIPELLGTQSRLSVISFHSLEDRIVKNSFKSREELRRLKKKPIIPTEDEIKNNPRSRSEKLRVAEKINEHSNQQNKIL